MAIHSLMMASLAAEKSLLLVDNSQMPYHGNQRNQPQRNRSLTPQVHCDRYDDVVDLITQVDLVEKTNFSIPVALRLQTKFTCHLRANRYFPCRKCVFRDDASGALKTGMLMCPSNRHYC